MTNVSAAKVVIVVMLARNVKDVLRVSVARAKLRKKQNLSVFVVVIVVVGIKRMSRIKPNLLEYNNFAILLK